jgi:drug/metabolite transporter (DMT)-like permease
MAEADPSHEAEQRERRRRSWRRGIGLFLMVVGIALASLSGLCGLFFVSYDALLAVTFSGPVIAVGAALAWGGSSLRRSGRENLGTAEAEKVVRRFD